MGRPCKCCSHPDRARIDHDIRNGITISEIANRYDVSRMAVSRHKQHMDTQIATVIEIVKDAVTKNLPAEVYETQKVHEFIDVYEELLAHFKDIKDAAADAKVTKDVQDRVRAGKEIRETIRDMAKLLGLVNADGISIDLIKMQERLEHFKRLVMEEVCDDCRRRLHEKFNDYIRAEI